MHVPTSELNTNTLDKVDPALEETFPDIPIGRELPSTTSSQASLNWALKQLQHCRTNHKTCNSHSSSPLPTRILDVSKNSVRLHEPSRRDTTFPYIALSHCWGRTPFLRTLSTNLSAHKSAIPWSSLPPTFRDAIQTARSLSISYLWIDSLCIIQDDPLDWAREAASMASIYQGAHLVLSASHSASAHGGMFSCFPDSHKSYLIPIPAPQQPFSASVFVRRGMITHAATRGVISPYHHQASKGGTEWLPAFTRGWIMQERLLSSRILHFNRQELSWECLEGSGCQCTPDTDADTDASASTNTITKKARDNAIPKWYKQMLERSASPKKYYSVASWEGMSGSERVTGWQNLVEDYTKLELSFERDVFPALGGMARVFKRVIGGGGRGGEEEKYLAGLWEGSLVRGLVWHFATLGGKEGGKRRPEKWRAPTWSWGSVLGPVEYLSTVEGVEESIEVIAAGTDLAGVDEMGEVAGGRLVIKGRVVKCRMKMVENGRAWDKVGLDILEGGYLKNLWADDLEECKGVAEDREGEVGLLLVGRKLPRRELVCLMLVGVDEEEGLHKEGSTYKRIGLLEVFGGPPGWVDSLLEKGEDDVVRIV